MIIKEHYLKIPLQDADLIKLSIGDVVYLDGLIYTGREGLYNQLFNNNNKLPKDLSEISNVTFHCSPAITENDNGEYRVTSVTGTASFRFSKYMDKFLHDFKVKAVIGKGGMPQSVYKKSFIPNGSVYLSTIGYGLGAIYGSTIEKVEDVIWKEELGYAQAIWVFRVKNFGPLFVESDVDGNSMFVVENERINKSLQKIYKSDKEPILKRIGEKSSIIDEML